jgi:hypothetical protein
MTDSPRWVPVLILFGLLALAYLGMWRGWRRRGRRHDLPPLVAVPEEGRPASQLEASGRYFGTTVAGDWLDRVVARGLGARSSCRVELSGEGLDVLRPGGSFRVAAAALRGARHERGIAGKVVPPQGLLVVTWQHGEHLLDSGFRLSADAGDRGAGGSVHDLHDRWVQALSAMARESA